MSEAYYPCNLCGVSVRRGEQGKHLLKTCSHTRPDFINKAELLTKLREEVEGLEKWNLNELHELIMQLVVFPQDGSDLFLDRSEVLALLEKAGE